MKKAILSFFAGIIVMTAISFKLVYEPKVNTAEANKYENIYIFTDSEPVGEYKYLGTVKPKNRALAAMGINSGQYTDLRDRLIKAVKKDYPDANGLILELKDGGVDKADAILIKDSK